MATGEVPGFPGIEFSTLALATVAGCLEEGYFGSLLSRILGKTAKYT
jgi:hypothetical protein